MWKRIPLILAVLLGLTACGQPDQSHTYNGQACHPVGYWFAPIWVAPNGHSAC